MFEHVSDKPFEWIGPPQAGFLEISDWGIDEAVTGVITANVGTGYRLQSIAIERQDFDTWTYKSLGRRIRELPMPETPVDAYLLVLRDWRSDDIGHSSHAIAGLGLYRRDLPNRGERTGVFASYRLVLMEPDRGRVIASRAALLPDGHLPWLPVSSVHWIPSQDDLTAAQREMLHRDFQQLIEASLPGTLHSLGLHTQFRK